MSVTFVKPSDKNEEYYQFDFIQNITSIKGILKNENENFFIIENPDFVGLNQIRPLDNIIYIAKSQVLFYYQINKD